MKTAFIHCRIMPGGGLSVLRDLISNEQFHEAKIFTLISDRDELEVDGLKMPVVTALPRRLNSFFVHNSKNNIPGMKRLFDYRNLMAFYPILMSILSIKLRNFPHDKTVVSSFAISKNINIDTSKPSLLYLHSPMQYIRTHRDEYTNKLSGLKGHIFKKITSRLKKWDTQSRTFSHILANSEYTKQAAKDIYGWEDIKVSYPEIKPIYLHSDPYPEHMIQDYFVYVGRLVSFVKEVEKIINLCNTTGDNLILIGSGPDEHKLKMIAGPTITFTGEVSDPEQIIQILGRSRGLINITKESFGLVTAEALCLGVPVFGYNAGGSVELVDADSGILVDHKDHKTLVQKFEEFKTTERDRSKIKAAAMKKFG